MTEQEVFNGLKKIIEQNAPRDGRPSTLSMETNLEDLGIDSAHRIDILARLYRNVREPVGAARVLSAILSLTNRASEMFLQQPGLEEAATQDGR